MASHLTDEQTELQLSARRFVEQRCPMAAVRRIRQDGGTPQTSTKRWPPYALPSLAALADPSHVVFGSDFPFMPEGVLAETVAGLASFFSGPELGAVERGNAAQMFVRLCRAAGPGDEE